MRAGVCVEIRIFIHPARQPGKETSYEGEKVERSDIRSQEVVGGFVYEHRIENEAGCRSGGGGITTEKEEDFEHPEEKKIVKKRK